MEEITINAGERKSLVLIHDSPESKQQTVRLAGDAAEVIIDEIFLDGNAKSDLTIIHDARHTVSRVNTRGVVGKQQLTKSHVNIIMPKHAQLSDSDVSQRFLLLDNSAKADARPALEIEANEVKAAHAAMVSPIDETKLFYLTSRGLSQEEAKKLIIEGFLQVPE